MYCTKCGKEVLEGARFCAVCGAKIKYRKNAVPQTVEETSIEEEEIEQQTMREEKVSEEQVSETQVPEESIQMETADEKPPQEEDGEAPFEANNSMSYDLEGALENEEPIVIMDNTKKAAGKGGKVRKIGIIIAIILVLCGGLAGVGYVLYQDQMRWNSWVAKYKTTMQEYYLSEEEQSDYNDYVQQAEEAKDEKSRETIKNKMEKLQKTVKEENDAYIKKMDENLQKIENGYDLEYALEEELTEIAEAKKKYEELREQRNYPEAIAQTEKCMELSENAAEIREGWNLSIQQKDVSAYPTVKLYFSVEDEDGNAVENLKKNVFFLSQKDAENGEYLKHKIVNATQLNENESLNVNLVADISGSMSGNMDATKEVMNAFLDTVQFDVGDKVGLMAFDDISYRLSDFTDSKSSLSSAINGMVENGTTKLYDTLIEAVQTVLPQNGAKCVIAFTDGYDNRSASDVQDVIDYANRYQIPIFIIGIGDDVETGILREIAESTGGFYKSVDYVDSSFEDIYAEIYRIQKEVYCLEYVVDSDNMNETQDVSIYVRNRKHGGQTTCQYTASEDYFSILLQQYLTSYLDALTAGDYSIMEQAGYMSKNGGIAKEMKAYITKNQEKLSEQLLSSLITDIEYVDKDTYIVETEEIYDIQQERNYIEHLKDSKQDDDKEAIRYMEEDGYDMEDLEEENLDVAIHKTRTLQGHFVIKRNSDGKWQFADYKSAYEVLDSEIYTAYPMAH